MTARSVIEHALRVYYADDRDPQAFVAQLLDLYDAERDTAREQGSRLEGQIPTDPHPAITATCPRCHGEDGRHHVQCPDF